MVWVFSLPSSEASVVIDAADPAEGKCIESVNDYIEIVGELPLGLILSPIASVGSGLPASAMTLIPDSTAIGFVWIGAVKVVTDGEATSAFARLVIAAAEIGEATLEGIIAGFGLILRGGTVVEEPANAQPKSG